MGWGGRGRRLTALRGLTRKTLPRASQSTATRSRRAPPRSGTVMSTTQTMWTSPSAGPFARCVKAGTAHCGAPSARPSRSSLNEDGTGSPAWRRNRRHRICRDGAIWWGRRQRSPFWCFLEPGTRAGSQMRHGSIYGPFSTSTLCRAQLWDGVPRSFEPRPDLIIINEVRPKLLSRSTRKPYLCGRAPLLLFVWRPRRAQMIARTTSGLR